MNTLLISRCDCFEIMISHYDRKLYQLEKRRKGALGVRK